MEIDYHPLEVDIQALTYHLEDMPNSTREIAKELDVSEDRLHEILETSDIFYDARDGYVRKKTYEDEIGKWQVAFPHAVTCDKCEDDIPALNRYYIFVKTPVSNKKMCESCIKKKKMLEGLNKSDNSGSSRVSMFGSSGSGKTAQMFNKWRRSRK